MATLEWEKLPKRNAELLYVLLDVPPEARCYTIDAYLDRLSYVALNNSSDRIRSIHGSGYIFSVATNSKKQKQKVVACYIEPVIPFYPSKVLAIFENYSSLHPLVLPPKDVLYAILKRRFHFRPKDLKIYEEQNYVYE